MLQRPSKLISRSVTDLNLISKRTCTKHRDLPLVHELHNIIKWNEPEKIPFWDPRRSCDLKPLPKVDPNWLKWEYQPFEEMLNKLPEEQRKIFSVEFHPRRDGIKVIMEETLARVRRHKYDGVEGCGERSFEHKIAWATIRIRNLRVILTEIEIKPGQKKNGMFKNQCKELVEKRKKFLNRLRHKDYKRFEWIIEVLGVIFKPNAKFEKYHRKMAIDKLTDMLCEKIISDKMNAYKAELESQKIPFLEEKLAILQEIRGDEEAMNLTPSVTGDIQETINRIEKLKKTYLEIHPVDEEKLAEDAVVLA